MLYWLPLLIVVLMLVVCLILSFHEHRKTEKIKNEIRNKLKHLGRQPLEMDLELINEKIKDLEKFKLSTAEAYDTFEHLKNIKLVICELLLKLEIKDINRIAKSILHK